jgi:glycosyltransferase involved in cell wall biosynthesis
MVSKFDSLDGLSTRANAVLSSLLERGHEVHAFTRSKNVAFLPPERIHRFGGLGINVHFSIDAIDAPKTIAKECNRHGIEVLDVQMNSGTTDLVLPFFKANLPPMVVTYHLAYSDAESSMSALFNTLGKVSVYSSRRYDAIILVHPFQKRMFLPNGVPEEKLNVIVNGVDTGLFKPREHEKDHDIIDFIYVGRLSYDKGVHILIQAFREYHKENSRSRLTLIGGGMLSSMLTSQDSESIRWLGNVDHSLVHKYLQKADIFVVPMSIGPLTASISVLEAMSCGLPLITTNVADANRILSTEEGILVKPESVPAVVDAMRTMAKNEKMRDSMGRQCRERILRDYSWNRQIGLIEAVYRQIISQ